MIVSSAFHEIRSTIAAYKIGANVCLAAPVDREMLVAVLQSMAESRLRDERRTRAETTTAIGQFTKQMAESFNGAIMAMLGHLNLLLDSVPWGSGNRASVERAVDAASRLAELAQQFLASGGKAGSSVGPVDLSQLVRDVEGVLRSRLPAKCPLALDLQDGLPLFIGDAGQIQDLLVYLVTNAAEAIGPAPGSSIHITTSALVIDESLAREYIGYEPTQAGNYLCLEIRAAGLGIDGRAEGGVFDPFFFTQDTGCGLALSRVLAILRNHKGGLRIDSGGYGARFAVCFPQADSEEIRHVRHVSRRFART
jgi:signal transduction histidine kinase